MFDFKENPFSKEWWDKKAVGSMTREDVVWIVLALIVAVLSHRFPIDWVKVYRICFL